MSRSATDLTNGHYRKRFRGVNDPAQLGYEFDDRNVSDWNDRNSLRDQNIGVSSATNQEYILQNRNNLSDDYRNYSRDRLVIYII